MAETGRKSAQIPERTHALLRALNHHHWVEGEEEEKSIGSLIAIAVDIYIKHLQATGQWVPSKRDLRRKP